MTFANKVAIVTGGASGIGRALCTELARRGAIVIVADLNGEEARRTAEGLEGPAGSASAAQVDVASPDSLQTLIRDTLARHGRIDLLFNNAGVGWTGDFHEMSRAHADRVVDINLNGVVYGALAAYPAMVAQRSGHIVNTSSFFAGLIPVPGKTVYSATKHAIVGFSLALRAEARRLGVRVSVVCPSFISSNIDQNSARILRGDTPSAESSPPPKTLDAGVLARAILKGVARNRAIIVRPSFIRPFWWLYRASPALGSKLLNPFMTRRVHRAKRSRFANILLSPARKLFRLLLGGRGRS